MRHDKSAHNSHLYGPLHLFVMVGGFAGTKCVFVMRGELSAVSHTKATAPVSSCRPYDPSPTR